MIQISIPALNAVRKMLKSIPADAGWAVKRQILISEKLMQVEMKRSMERTKKSTVGIKRTKTKLMHYPSLPGYPPAKDYGHLWAQIFVDPTELGGEVGAVPDYAAYLEEGTGRMAARPFMNPAAEKEVPRLIKRLREILGGGS